jgi:hypothetical protein
MPRESSATTRIVCADLIVSTDDITAFKPNFGFDRIIITLVSSRANPRCSATLGLQAAHVRCIAIDAFETSLEQHATLSNYYWNMTKLSVI